MDESERYQLGQFEDCQAAVEACRRIVDEFLARISPDRTAEEIFKEYTMFGEDPWVSGPDAQCRFSAWDYARQRCKELAKA
jgi:hypothetical protein